MSHIPFSSNGNTPFEKLIGYNTDILSQWAQLETAIFNISTFDQVFLEQLRRALAFNNVCQYCMAKAGPPDHSQSDTRLNEALHFANKFALDHRSIDESDISRLKEIFTTAEISELTLFCAFISASQQFGAVLGLQPAEHYKDTHE
jgi:alkylhydroperoxidase family enzyme